MKSAVSQTAHSLREDEAPAEPRLPKTLILGLGNPLLGDDSVGLRVARDLRKRGPGPFCVDEDYCGGLRLMERMIGFERAIIVDACCTGAAPGTVRVLPADALPTRHTTSAHDVDLAAALALGRSAGAALPAPRNIRVVAIEAAQCLTFQEECTPAVAASIGPARDAVLALLADWR